MTAETLIEQTPVGVWVAYGSFDPVAGQGYGINTETFTIGVFQVVAKKTGGKKASKAVIRVKGFNDTPEVARARAQRIVDALNAAAPMTYAEASALAKQIK